MPRKKLTVKQRRARREAVSGDIALAMGGFAQAVFESFRAYETVTIEQAKAIFKALATDVFLRTRKDTPVKTGFARSGWRITVFEEEYSLTILIWNAVVYIVALEYGHSQQAPNGMLRINFNKARDRLVAAREELLGG